MFIVAALFFSLVALFMAFYCHDRFDPARWFSLMWAGQVLLFYALFHRLFVFNGYGLVFIALLCLTFSLGSLTGRLMGRNVPAGADKPVYHFREKGAFAFLLVSLLLGFLNILLSIREYGYTLKEVFNLEALMRMNEIATELRYRTDLESGLLHQLTLIFVYLSPLYGGYLMPLLAGKRKKWVCYLTVLPALLISITETMKFPFIAGMVLWLVGILVGSYAHNPGFLRLKKGAWVALGTLGGVFFAIMLLAMFFRAGTFEAEVVENIKLDFLNYACGHLPAFDEWFYRNMDQLDPDGGTKTFYGITNYLGLAVRKQGVFEEWVYYGQSVNHQIPPALLGTNVYTMFRFLLEDFGFVGAFIYIFLNGMVAGFAWLMVKLGRMTFFFQTCLVAVLFSIPMSFIASIWAWTSTIATVCLFFVVLGLTFARKGPETVVASHSMC